MATHLYTSILMRHTKKLISLIPKIQLCFKFQHNLNIFQYFLFSFNGLICLLLHHFVDFRIHRNLNCYFSDNQTTRHGWITNWIKSSWNPRLNEKPLFQMSIFIPVKPVPQLGGDELWQTSSPDKLDRMVKNGTPVLADDWKYFILCNMRGGPLVFWFRVLFYFEVCIFRMIDLWNELNCLPLSIFRGFTQVLNKGPWLK